MDKKHKFLEECLMEMKTAEPTEEIKLLREIRDELKAK
jgi:large-conductance mechanosensitive channel